MIPVKLTLRNFMSYRETDLDFRTLRVACLAGENGAGKSAIFDAMTWALWEKARSSDSDQLIRLGESEMGVEFLFALEGDQYRVQRTRHKGRNGSGSSLELQVLGSAGWRVISGKGIRETQKRINEILCMDYQTFINASFILQGRADEFTTRNPAERKKVLADILGLGLYDELQKLAKLEASRLEMLHGQVEGEVAALSQKLQGLDEARRLAGELAAQLAEAEATRREAAGRQQETQQLCQRLASEQAGLEEVARHHAATGERLGLVETELGRLAGRLAEIERFLADEERIAAGYRRWQDLGREEAETAGRGVRYLEWDREHRQLAREVNAARHALELEAQRLAERLRQAREQLREQQAIAAERDKILWGLEQAQQARAAEREYLGRSQRLQGLEIEKGALARAIAEYRQRWQLERGQLRNQIAERDRLCQDAPGYRRELAELTERLESLKRMAVEADHIKEKGINGRRGIEAIQAAIAGKEREIAERRERLAGWTESRPEESTCPLCETPLEHQERSRLIDKYREQIAAFEEAIARSQHEIADQESTLAAWRRRYAELAEPLKGSDAVQQRYGELSRLVEQAQAAENDLERLWDDWAEADALLDDGELIAPELVPQLATLERQLAGIDFSPAQLAVLQARVSDWRWAEVKHARLEEVERGLAGLGREAARLETEAGTMQERLNNNDYAHPEQHRLSAVEAELAAIAYDPARHAELRDELARHQGFQEDWQRLQTALVQRREAEGERERLALERTGLTAAVQAESAKLVRLQPLTEELRQASATLAEWQERALGWQEKVTTLHGQLARSQERVEGMERDEALLAEKEAERSGVLYELELHRELAAAFGKNGIQALIIENAVPEIENEANRLLARLTDGRMHVTIATTKENKTNDRMNETLELFISDELGTRNYELYSGGEAFRINFAIRLALSRILARRAGAKLQTLIIDEGFGTQDAQGRQRLLETLSVIENDFEKILVITHMSDIKEAFSARIEVFKSPQGSQIRVFQ